MHQSKYLVHENKELDLKFKFIDQIESELMLSIKKQNQLNVDLT